MYISDGYGNFRIHHYDSKGKLKNSWGKPGEGAGEFITPHSLVVDDKSHLLVADRDNNRIQIFDLKGEYIDEIRNFFHPMKIFKDNDGFIYVTDQTPSLCLFNQDYELIGRFKTLGLYGHGVTVDQNGSIYIAEQFVDRVVKFNPLND